MNTAQIPFNPAVLPTKFESMEFGVNVPNFGPGTDPGLLRAWADTVESLGFDLLMMSDHVAITPDVAQKYPAPFFDPFTTLAYLAGASTGIRLGTTVLILPYRHPLLTARMAANLNDLSGGRFVLGVGVGWARQEFQALGAPFERRGRLTDEYLQTIRNVWRDETDYRAGTLPIWIGGDSPAALRRAVQLGDAWHPMRFTLPWLRSTLPTLGSLADAAGRPAPAFAPRISLSITERPVDSPDRLAGVGSVDQVVDDFHELRLLGASSVVLDPFNGDLSTLPTPQPTWNQLDTIMTAWTRSQPAATSPETFTPSTTIGAQP